MSHSNGAGSVSSKSLMSNTGVPSGEAKVPKFARWQSPEACTQIPVAGVSARSAAMIAAAPRKNANGDARIRSYLIGSKLAMRCRPDSIRISIGSRRLGDGVQRACRLRGTTLRKDWPAWRRSAIRQHPNRLHVLQRHWDIPEELKYITSQPRWIASGKRAASPGFGKKTPFYCYNNKSGRKIRTVTKDQSGDDARDHIVRHDAERAMLPIGPADGTGFGDVEHPEQEKRGEQARDAGPGQSQHRDPLPGELVDHHPAGIARDLGAPHRDETAERRQQRRHRQRNRRQPQQHGPNQHRRGRGDRAGGHRRVSRAEAGSDEPGDPHAYPPEECLNGLQRRGFGQDRRMADARQRDHRAYPAAEPAFAQPSPPAGCC